MTAEREIAGFALPFTAGAALTAYADTVLTFPPILISAIIVICTSTLIHPKHKSLSDRTLLALIIILGFSCGAYCSLNAILIPSPPQHLQGKVLEFNTALKESISRISFNNSSANSLITALITGDRSLLSQEVIGSFRTSGASHILALSGFHLGIIYSLLKALASTLGNRYFSKTIRSTFIILACGFYTAATGAGPSIVRAFLFILLGETAILSSRHRSTGTILWTALLIQLIFNPISIRQVGFQLSYAAMAGIVYIHPVMKAFWPDDGYGIISKVLKRLWNSASLSISCQIMTAPIAWIYFETFPKHFLLTNLIALPLTGLIIPAALGLLLLDKLGICPRICIDATGLLIDCLTDSLRVIASF
jgi:competence protein ComEC